MPRSQHATDFAVLQNSATLFKILWHGA